MGNVDAVWLDGTRAVVRRIAAEVAACELSEVSALVERLVASIVPPPDLLHHAALATALLDGCREIVDRLHQRSSMPSCACHAVSWSDVGRFARWQEHDTRLVFRDWLRVLLDRFGLEHPATPGVRVAAMIRANPTQCWTLRVLAARAGIGAARLRDDFDEHFGVKPAAYVQLVRATRAVALFRTAQKVEAVAWEVGYRSKKDLYVALRRWVGATPTELRAVSEIERDWLNRQLRTRCLRGVMETPANSAARESSSRPASLPRVPPRRPARQRRR